MGSFFVKTIIKLRMMIINFKLLPFLFVNLVRAYRYTLIDLTQSFRDTILHDEIYSISKTCVYQTIIFHVCSDIMIVPSVFIDRYAFHAYCHMLIKL